MRCSIGGLDTRLGMYRQEVKAKETIFRLMIAHLYCLTYRRMLAQVMGCTKPKEEEVAMSLPRGVIPRQRQPQAGDAGVCPAVNHQHRAHT